MKKIIVLFVEGETEKEFYTLLIDYYRSKIGELPIVKIFNLKGIGRFEGKVTSKLKYDILNHKKYSGLELDVKVFCCYDTDVFEFGKKPPTNWNNVKRKVNELGINSFYSIKAERMIEDWFLKDLDGLCSFLKIKKPKKIKGKDGVEKMKFLFKKSGKPKIYQKGHYTHLHPI